MYVDKSTNIYDYQTSILLPLLSYLYDSVLSAVRETSVSHNNSGPMGVPLKPLNTIMLWWSKGFQGGLQLGTH